LIRTFGFEAVFELLELFDELFVIGLNTLQTCSA